MKALISLLSLACAVASYGAVELPAWAKAASASQTPAIVSEIVAGEHTDLVVLNGGYDIGLRNGMVLQVALSSEASARLLVAGASAESAVALILELPEGHSLSSGGKAYPSVIRL